MIPVLREYQQRDLNAVRAAMREYDSVLLVQPTGAGKGTLASFIVHSAVAKGKRCLFLVNRRTLVHDMSMRLDRLGIEHGVIMGDDPRRKPWLSTHVASIDTLHRRETLPVADLLIVDETHFAVSPTWAKVLDRYKGVKRLHMTATPIRLDGRGLEEICDVMVMGPSVQELIDLGFLVPSVVFAPPRPVNTGHVKKTAGDFNQGALAQVCDTAKLVGDIVQHWQRHASDRKTAVFAVDQKHAKHIQEQFNTAGIEMRLRGRRDARRRTAGDLGLARQGLLPDRVERRRDFLRLGPSDRVLRRPGAADDLRGPAPAADRAWIAAGAGQDEPAGARPRGQHSPARILRGRRASGP